MLDRFASKFLLQFRTREDLLSQECRAILFSIGRRAKIDISTIECRHASLRRFILARSSTYQLDVPQLASDFMLLRARLQARCWTGPRGALQAKRRAGRDRRADGSGCAGVRKPGKRAHKGGGGAQRAFFSQWLRGKRFRTQQDRAATFAEGSRAFTRIATEGGAEAADLQRQGAAGTSASRHRSGKACERSAFGRPTRFRRDGEAAANVGAGIFAAVPLPAAPSAPPAVGPSGPAAGRGPEKGSSEIVQVSGTTSLGSDLAAIRQAARKHAAERSAREAASEAALAEWSASQASGAMGLTSRRVVFRTRAAPIPETP